MAGQYDESEVETIQKMFSIERNRDYFDKAFYQNDMQSMRDFIAEANKYDDRDKFIQEWLWRKEGELKTRTQLPPTSLKKTDSEIYAMADKNLKRARESLVAQMLTHDEFGKQN